MEERRCELAPLRRRKRVQPTQQDRDGVVAEARDVGHVELRPVEVRACDQRVGIEQVDRGRRSEAGDEGAHGEEMPAAPQRSHPEPQEHDAEPEDHPRRVEPQLGQGVGALVETHRCSAEAITTRTSASSTADRARTTNTSRRRDGAPHQLPEDRVGGREEPAEQREERESDRGAASDRPGPLRPQPLHELGPGDVGAQQPHRARERGRTGGDEARRVVRDAGAVHVRLRPPQRAQRHRARDRQQVCRRQDRRVMPEEAGGEEEQGRGHPPATLLSRPTSTPILRG